VSWKKRGGAYFTAAPFLVKEAVFIFGRRKNVV